MRQIFNVPLDRVQWRNELMRHVLQILNALMIDPLDLTLEISAAILKLGNLGSNLLVAPIR
ncbi:MAG: hypothetical protein ACOYXU_08710 [Nitrospirota bacterium]